MTTFIDALPVLLNVIDLLDVSTLRALRHTCRPTHDLITNYEWSIVKRLWDRSHDRYSFPQCSFEEPSSLKDLSRLDSAYRLACTVASSKQPIGGHGILMRGIEPNEAFGDELRARVTKGFLIWHTLSRLSTGVTTRDNATDQKRFRWARMHRSNDPISRQKAVEEGVLGVWQSYLESLPSDDLVNLVLTERCVRGKIRLDGVRTGIGSRMNSKTGLRTAIDWRRSLWGAVKMDREPDALRWLVNYLLRRGPTILADLWCEDPMVALEAQSQVLAGIRGKSLKLILLEDETRNELMRKVRRPIQPSIQDCDNAYSEAWAYYTSTFHFRKEPSAYQGIRQEVLAQRHDETLAAIMSTWI